MSHVLSRRSRPFCNVRNGYGINVTPQQVFDGGIFQGTEWDGEIYYPDAEVYPLGIYGYIPSGLTHGPGTAYPFGLNFEQLQRWYWALDEWQFRITFEYGSMTDGADDGPFTTYTIDYDEFPDNGLFPDEPGGVPDPTMPLRRRIVGRKVVIHPIKEVSNVWGTNYVTASFDMSGSVLVDPTTPGVYYPHVGLSLSAPGYNPGSPHSGSHIQQDSSGARINWSLPGVGQPDPASVSTDTGLTFAIDDGTGTTFQIPIFRDPSLDTIHAPPDGVEFSVRFLSGDAKPTGYLATV